MASIKENEQEIFISPKEMKEVYPKGDFKIVGEYVKNKRIKIDEGFLVETADGITKRVRHAGYYKHFKYKTIAYQLIDEDEYIAVLKMNWLLMLLILLIIIGLLFGGYFLWKSTQGPDIDPAIKDYVAGIKRPDDLSQSQIAVPGITEIVMQADTNVIKGDVLINPKGNPCYFQYSIVDDKSNELLYESKLVPPGKSISEVRLKKKMKQGTYNITLKINTFDLDQYDSRLNGAEVKSVLRVLK